MQEKLSILSELIHLSKADNEMREDEMGFIKVIAEGLGVSDAELEQLYENPVAFDPGTTDGERILQFHRLVLLMNVDRNISDAEMNNVRQAGIKLGLNPMATNEVLKRMYDYPNNVIPPNELIAIFVKHHN